jgi:protein SCO1/2
VVALALLAAAIAAFVPTLQPGDAIPPIPLIDQSGRAFSLAQLRGEAVVLTFIYTRCADPRMCPLASSKFAQLQARIGRDPIRLVEITLDPAFDTPAVLRAYGRAFAAQPQHWTLATGAPASIEDLSERLDIATQWTRPGTLAHTESAIVIDRDGRIARIVPGNTWTVSDLLALARDAAGAQQAPTALIALWLTAAVASCGGSTGAINVLEALALFAAVSGAIAFAFLRALRR